MLLMLYSAFIVWLKPILFLLVILNKANSKITKFISWVLLIDVIAGLILFTSV